MNRLSRLDSSSSSDHDDDDQQTHPWCTTSSSYSIPGYAYSTVGGSVPGRQYTHRDREAGHWRLYNDYFSEAPTYDASIFRRRCVKLSFFPRLLHAAIWSTTCFLFLFLWLRFRMARPLFLRIAHAVAAQDNYFVKKETDAEGLGYHVCRKFVQHTWW